MNMWPGMPNPGTPNNAAMDPCVYCSSGIWNVRPSCGGGPISCMGSPTKIAPGPLACSAAYWASISTSEDAAVVGVEVGAAFVGVAAGVGAAFVAVGAGVVVAMGSGSSPPHAANPKANARGAMTGTRQRFIMNNSLPQLSTTFGTVSHIVGARARALMAEAGW